MTNTPGTNLPNFFLIPTDVAKMLINGYNLVGSHAFVSGTNGSH